MRSVVAVKTQFSASHLVEDHPTCGKLHGHTWRVTIESDGNIGPMTGYIPDVPDLSLALVRVAVELDHRDLNAMLPGVVTMPEGIASYFRERLLMQFPSISAVVVEIDSYSARVEWALR